MKRLVLLSVVALMLAPAVFAPVALAQVPGEVDVQSLELGPGGSVRVTATVQCVEGSRYDASVIVRQRSSGNILIGAQGSTSGICPTTGPVTFTFTQFGQTGGDRPETKPFHRGPATVQTFGRICAPEGFPCEPDQRSIEEARIR
jgi:hypothetical protein